MVFGLGSLGVLSTISATGIVSAVAWGLALGLAAAAPTAAVAQENYAAGASVEVPRQKELIALVRQDCGSCHGLTLQGGLGPALLPETLNGKPADYLSFIILQGRANTAMPPWKRFLNEAEAQWIAVNLKKGFPDGH